MTSRWNVVGMRVFCVGMVLLGCGNTTGDPSDRGESPGLGQAGGTSVTGSDSSTAPPEVIAFREELVAAYCHTMVECTAGRVLDPRDDLERCVSEQTKEIASDPSWSLEDLALDAPAAQDCLVVIASPNCPGVVEAGAALTSSCQDAVRGTAELSEPCAWSRQCRAGLWCDLTSSCPGECVAFSQQGDACVDNRCAAGLTCFEDTCALPTPAARLLSDSSHGAAKRS